MRLAMLSDIHGNPIALEAVLADIQVRGGADSHLVLGDIVAIGHDPVGVLERLSGLRDVHFVQGNTDRGVVTGQRPYPRFEDAQTNPALIPRLVEVALTYAWTQGYVTAAGWFDWLAALPIERRMVLPDGTRLLGVHVAPGHDDGPGIHPRLTDDELSALVRDAAADLVCVGHTHWPVDRTVAGVRVINVGSVSNPIAFDLRASYAMLETSGGNVQVDHYRVAYDVGAVIEAIERSRHPSGGFIISHFRAERRPWWAGGPDGREKAPVGPVSELG